MLQGATSQPGSYFAKLSQLVTHKRVVPILPEGRIPKLPGAEVDTPPGEGDGSASWGAFIVYTDAKGVQSARRITCKKIIGFGRAEIVRSWCHERAGWRSFDIERINELVCVDSGEVLDPVEHFEALRLRGALNVDDKALTELARILVFLARCDGEYHPLEITALEDLFSRYAVRFGGCDHGVAAAVKACRRLAPDGDDLVRALGSFAQAPNGQQLCRFVLDAGAAIVDADRRHAPEEIGWAIEMSSALKAVVDRKR